MPDNLRKNLCDALAEARACLLDLRALGLYDIPGVELASLPPCPPGVSGVERGGAETCRQETLAEVRAALGDCQRCALSQNRARIVFGAGDPHARVVLVGDAPGREDEGCGQPFAGETGDLLERMLFAIGLTRESVYLCQLTMCRPLQPRPPAPQELAACEPFFQRQIAAIRPALILALGDVVRQRLVDGASRPGADDGAATGLGIPVVALPHPAELLRDPARKREAWEGLKLAMRRLREEN